MILDAGVLISIDRAERGAMAFLDGARRTETPLHTTHPVLAQVWRHGARQARLASALDSVTIHPFDDGRPVGRLLAETETADVVDAHLVITAVLLGQEVLTSDPDDLGTLADALGPAGPMVHAWP